MKHRIGLLVILAWIAAVLFSSCKAVYMPAPINVPMLTNRGEIQINTNLGFYGLSPQGAYALTNHLGMTFNLAISGLPNKDSSDYQYSFSPGIGYFYKANKFRFEVYTGLGGGEMASAYSDGNTKYFDKYGFRNFYFQPTVGYTSNLLDIGLTSQFELVSFMHKNGTNDYSTIIWEPVLTTKIGYKRVRFLGQVGIAVDFNQAPQVYTFPFIMTLGLNINLGKARYVGRSMSRYKGEKM